MRFCHLREFYHSVVCVTLSFIGDSGRIVGNPSLTGDYGRVARDPLRVTESRDLGKDPFALCEGGFKRHGPKNILEEIWSGRISAA